MNGFPLRPERLRLSLGGRHWVNARRPRQPNRLPLVRLLRDLASPTTSAGEAVIRLLKMPYGSLSFWYGQSERGEEAMSERNQEQELIAALTALLADYPDYEAPRLRKDGDVVIPLDAVLKKNRQAQSSLADALSEMMREDLGPRRSSAWIK
jgi:hypothetical protein